jgi:hypothetical protein
VYYARDGKRVQVRGKYHIGLGLGAATWLC